MDGSGRSGLSRAVRWQATALAIVLPADGIAAYLLGAPEWVALLYVALGIGLAALRLRLGRTTAAPPAPPAPHEEATPDLPTATVDRAIGYVCVPSASNGELGEQTAAVTSLLRAAGARPAVRRA